MSVIAQFATPPEGLEVPLWPLVFFGILYAALFVAARTLAGRGDERSADGVDRAAFIVMLLAALYTVGLGIYAISQRSERIWEMIKIMLIIFVFFMLLLAFMLLWEMLIGAIGRSRSARRRRRAPVPAEEQAPAAPPSAGQPG